jgi:tRNA threonylcarbamoyladenosine biosynthesis protein TsaE
MTGALEVICCRPSDTRSVAAAVAPFLQPGDVVLLDGDLGAGKTTFTQGLARALGVPEGVTSPTFTLVRSYPTAAGFDLLHVDVYRLDRLSEVVDLALPEYLEDGAVAVIEWGRKAAAALPGDHLQIDIDLTDTDACRRLSVDPVGSGWAVRSPAMGAAIHSAAGAFNSPPGAATKGPARAPDTTSGAVQA